MQLWIIVFRCYPRLTFQIFFAGGSGLSDGGVKEIFRDSIKTEKIQPAFSAFSVPGGGVSFGFQTIKMQKSTKEISYNLIFLIHVAIQDHFLSPKYSFPLLNPACRLIINFVQGVHNFQRTVLSMQNLSRCDILGFPFTILTSVD